MKKTRFIIIDEAPQLHVEYYVDLHEFLQELMDNSAPFGGVSVVFPRDFKKTLPIVRRENPLSQIRACIKSDDMIWSILRIISII